MTRMRAERRRRRWTQTDLAYHCRLSAADISRVETGRLQPSAAYRERIGRALGVPAAQLLDEVTE